MKFFQQATTQNILQNRLVNSQLQELLLKGCVKQGERRQGF